MLTQTDIQSRTRDGGTVTLAAASLKKLTKGLKGTVVTEDSPDYEEVRAIWNAMIGHRPAVIVRCAVPEDVITAVNFVREHGLLASVRGGGHNIAGSALCDGGVTIDLSGMKAVTVDPAARTARVEAGALLSDLDEETQKYGLATPLGINSTTGVAGLTLGGGFGWLSRSAGLTVDNLLSVDVVTADGALLHVSETEHPDLFWAIRGGGGNHGIVTSFEFRLYPVGPEILAGLVVHPLAHAGDVYRAYRKIAAELPDEASCWSVMRKAPPLPFLPEEAHGTDVLVLAMCHTGAVEDGEKALEPLRALGTPIAEHVGPMPYTEWQSAFDPLLEPGARNYWKSHNLVEMSDGAIDVLLDHVRGLPTAESEVFIAQLGAATARPDIGATAYPHRDANYVVNVHTRWRDPADDDRCVAWARNLYKAVAPHATGGVYVNFMPEDEGDRPIGPYGANEARLAAIKRRYDPENLFRVNRNIRPAA
jgi:FAD/FMN-containing dehydrogenase